jgi:hypothetical protein
MAVSACARTEAVNKKIIAKRKVKRDITNFLHPKLKIYDDAK